MDEARAWVESRDMGLRKLLVLPLFEQYYRLWRDGQDIKPLIIALDRLLRSTQKKIYRRY